MPIFLLLGAGAPIAAPQAASTDPMRPVFVLVLVLLAIALVLVALSKWLRFRQGFSAQRQRELLWAIPVPWDIQQAVRELMRTGDQVRAVSTLREAIPAVSLLQAKLLTDRLVEHDDHPTGYAEVVREIRERDPELDAQLRPLVEHKAEIEVVRLLRERLGLDLRIANELGKSMHE
ncbi:hypothetical protein OOZ19_17325 [Saccharopolyspora sp. NFXS83]|uniref:hypothetical protein n=1 Tax=Saccharopolyspora sp. NFXS83 TaxID=2993560 RepID=UPI00224B42BF|nr:hypothetical protein [Saccharopolyspora sp. NFXS83]MCX2732004.1 hypothetical protein [Saccharopolyspora sp. NFXS83]